MEETKSKRGFEWSKEESKKIQALTIGTYELSELLAEQVEELERRLDISYEVIELLNKQVKDLEKRLSHIEYHNYKPKEFR